MTPTEQATISVILGEGVKFTHALIMRGGKNRHTVTLTDTLDPQTERPIIGSGPSPVEAALKAVQKIPQK